MGVWLGALRFYNPASQDEEFFGNPNARASSIDASGGVVCSRTSGTTPCFVHVSASAFTAAGWYVDTDENTLTDLSDHFNSYEDIEYRITSDDAAAETLTRPTDGATVNLHDDQIGPCALFVFRTSGTKTITITARIKSGPTTFVSAQATQQITVTDLDTVGLPEFWFDSAANPVGADGTITNPWTTAADLRAIAVNNTYRNGYIANLKCGSTFSITNNSRWEMGSDAGGSGYRWRAYGSGAKPIVKKDYSVAGNTGAFFRNASCNQARGNVLSDIEFRLENPDEQIEIWNCNADGSNNTIKHFYWDNCDFYWEGGSVFDQAPSPMGMFTNGTDRGLGQQGNGFYKCAFTADGGYIQHIQPVINDFWSFVGCTMTAINGAQAAQATSVHWIYAHVKNHSLYRWNQFNALPGSFCLNINWDTSAGGADGEVNYLLISENDFDGTGGNSDSCATDIGQGAGSATSHYRTVVTERNAYHGWTHSNPNQEAGGNNVESRTMRGERAWDNVNFYTAPSFDAIYKLYQNLVHVSSDGPTSNFGVHDDARFGPIMVTDNIIVHGRAPVNDFNSAFNVGFMSWRSVSHQSLGSFCDRNTYFANHVSVSRDYFGFTGGALDKSFYEWQADGWDTNGHWMKNPLWQCVLDEADPTEWADLEVGTPTIIRVGSTVSIATARAAFLDEVFSGAGLPATGSDRSSLDVGTHPLGTAGLSPANLDQVDLHEFDCYDDGPTLVGTTMCWIHRPTVGTTNNKFVLNVLGHTHSTSWGSLIGYGTITKELIEEGYTVATAYMSPFSGTSTQAVDFHNSLPLPTAGYNALKLYIEGPVRIFNEFEGETWDKMFMCGLSGGGWMGAIWGALDDRADAIVSLAGFVTFHAAQVKDYEQRLHGLKDMVATGGCDYPDLLALASEGRAFKQILIQDDAEFSEDAYLGAPDYVPQVAAVALANGGTYELVIVPGNVHEWSTAARPVCIDFFNNH
jgi:hypothetical protein